MRPVPTFPPPSRLPHVPPPARPSPRSPASLSSQTDSAAGSPTSRWSTAPACGLRRAAARLPRTMVRRAGRGEGGGSGGGGGGGQRDGGREAPPLMRWAASTSSATSRTRIQRRRTPRRAHTTAAFSTEPPPTKLRLSEDGQHFFDSSLDFVYFDSPTLRTSHPPGGFPTPARPSPSLARASPQPSATPRRRAAASAGDDDRGRTDLGRRHRARVPAAAAAPRLLARHRVRAVGGARRRDLRRRCGAAGVCVLCGAVARGAAAGVEHDEGRANVTVYGEGFRRYARGGRRRPAVQVWGGGRDGGLAAPRAELGPAAP